MNENPQLLYFDDREIPKGSAREWRGGLVGHVSLTEARSLALAELEEAEAALEAAEAHLVEMEREFNIAKSRRATAYESRQKKRADVKSRQARVAYVCSTYAAP